MTRSAIRPEDLFAARDELLEIPGLVGIVGGGRSLLLLIVDPLRVVLLGLHLDDDRHEPVLLAAQLGALSAIDAHLVRLEPRVANEAGDGVLLDAERRYPPRVD